MMSKFRVVVAFSTLLFGAFSSSPGYKLQNYGISSGGTNNSSSSSYTLNGSSGEVVTSPNSSSTLTTKSGEIQAQQANVPLAPTLSNAAGSYYNKLSCTINTSGSDASDYTYSIAVSTNNFTTTNYVQADGTLGATPVYQSYAAWGAGAGTIIIGLTPAVTYQAKVNARQGTFTASAYGPYSAATTASPSLGFSVTPDTVNLGSLLPGTIQSGSVSFGFTTNGASGGSIYVGGANNGLTSATSGGIINARSGSLSAATFGFGMQSTATGQTTGGPLTSVSPFNGTASMIGATQTSLKQLYSTVAPIVGGSATASIKAKSSIITPAGNDYTETLTFIASANF